MKIKIKEIELGCMPIRVEGDKSDCFDLRLAEDVTLKKGEFYVARLGVAMELPKGMRANVFSRSSTPGKLNVQVANSVGIIDNVYNGDCDEWMIPLLAFKATVIPKGTRICQFEIVPSQFATAWQKLKWLFSNKVELVPVSYLNNDSRGGFGSTNYVE